MVSTAGDSYQWYLDGDLIAGETNQSITPSQNGVYTVETMAFNGCSGSNNFTVQNVSIEENLINIISIFPNPTNGIVEIKYSVEISYAIYNTLGELVLAENEFMMRHKLDIAHLTNAIYILRTSTKEGVESVHRLIKSE